MEWWTEAMLGQATCLAWFNWMLVKVPHWIRLTMFQLNWTAATALFPTAQSRTLWYMLFLSCHSHIRLYFFPSKASRNLECFCAIYFSRRVRLCFHSFGRIAIERIARIAKHNYINQINGKDEASTRAFTHILLHFDLLSTLKPKGQYTLLCSGQSRQSVIKTVKFYCTKRDTSVIADTCHQLEQIANSANWMRLLLWL
jgi:hypothetical protein